MIFLLDLNYTLISNSEMKRSPFIEQIKIETYREDLLDLLKDKKIFLLTARPAKYEQATMESIKEKTGWQPERFYFNKYNARPPEAKKRMLGEIFELFPPEDNQFFGIESNPKTRSMYAQFGIESLPYQSFIETYAEKFR